MYIDIYIYIYIYKYTTRKSSFVSNPRSQKKWLLEVKNFDFQKWLPAKKKSKTGCQSKKLTSDFSFKKVYFSEAKGNRSGVAASRLR